MGTGISSVTNKWSHTSIADRGNFIFAYLYLGGCPVWNIFTILSWGDAVSPLLPPKFYNRPLYLHGIWFLLIVWRLLQIARLLNAACLAYTQIRSCPPRHSIFFSTFMRSTYYCFEINCLKKCIHHTCHFELSTQTSIGRQSYHKAFSSTEQCRPESYFAARNLLWLTDTAAWDHIMIHRYCGTRAYYDSPILRRGVILWFTGTAALEPIMTHRHCGAGSYYDSPVLRH